MKTLRVLLADDHALFRAGLRSLLQGLDGIEVVAEAGDGREALALAATRHPDLAMMDVAMRGMNGLEAAARMVKELPRVKVLILSMHNSMEYVVEALRLGAAGYLLKDAGAEEMEMAVRAVARGETYLSPAVSGQIVADYVRRLDGVSNLLLTLTPRQREILQLVGEGKTTKEIAMLLNLSVKTVDTHRTQLMERLDIHDLAGMIRFAIRSGLVSV